VIVTGNKAAFPDTNPACVKEIVNDECYGHEVVSRGLRTNDFGECRLKCFWYQIGRQIPCNGLQAFVMSEYQVLPRRNRPEPIDMTLYCHYASIDAVCQDRGNHCH
jgi:hypothetical protein